MELNVWNIPKNRIYRFDTNKYLYKTKLFETRGGKHIDDGYFDVAEVYELTMEGYTKLVASGKMTDEPLKRQSDREFEIFDYDDNKTYRFKVTMHLQEVSLDELYELRDGISRNYRKMNK